MRDELSATRENKKRLTAKEARVQSLKAVATSRVPQALSPLMGKKLWEIIVSGCSSSSRIA